MMKSIVGEKLVSFKGLEQKIFKYACELGREITQTMLEDGRRIHVYLLDEAMQMDKIGLISTNLAEKIAMTVTESPYRATADIISSTCGQGISAGGVWNAMQRLGGGPAWRRNTRQNRWRQARGKGKGKPGCFLKKWAVCG